MGGILSYLQDIIGGGGGGGGGGDSVLVNKKEWGGGLSGGDFVLHSVHACTLISCKTWVI